MKEKSYESGTFCKAINCAYHKALEGLQGEEYLRKKAEYCKDCYAWKFYTWLKENGWKVVKIAPEMSTKELAARIKGIDPSKVEDLTVEEILAI
ncbi:MAG: hypothetical protein DRG37_01255 [Deltaproteobacteria bacterium]|nr:MAG: hypothetical protein DRG37_01255 [Deltaproteobacteria bacterium]